ncbi:MAG: MFS transporter [Buchnera aphidicola (Meitanaphis microgallis)]
MNKINIEIKEWKAIFGICIIFSSRVLGMFIVLPVFSTYGMYLKDSTIFLIGIAIGAYGFFQALFQIPYGWLSDKIGRKFVIILGLLFFLVGSCICFSSSSIWGIILGRSLQGSGAISSVCMALLSDIVLEKNKTKAMGILGISFGASFIISMVISPIIVRVFGFYGLFFISILLSIICILVTLYVIPFPICSYGSIFENNEYRNFVSVFKNFDLLQLNLNIFFLHLLLILNFIQIPVQLYIYENLLISSWMIYLITIIISFFVVFPISRYVEYKKCEKYIIVLSIIVLMLSDFIFLLLRNNCLLLILGLQMFFIVFSFLEMVLPVLVSRTAPKCYKGTAMAIYSISQFLGSSIGSVAGGLILNCYGINFLFLFELFITFLWFIINVRNL